MLLDDVVPWSMAITKPAAVVFISISYSFFIFIYCLNAMRCIELSDALGLLLGYHNHFSGAG